MDRSNIMEYFIFVSIGKVSDELEIQSNLHQILTTIKTGG